MRLAVASITPQFIESCFDRAIKWARKKYVERIGPLEGGEPPLPTRCQRNALCIKGYKHIGRCKLAAAPEDLPAPAAPVDGAPVDAVDAAPVDAAPVDAAPEDAPVDAALADGEIAEIEEEIEEIPGENDEVEDDDIFDEIEALDI